MGPASKYSEQIRTQKDKRVKNSEKLYVVKFGGGAGQGASFAICELYYFLILFNVLLRNNDFRSYVDDPLTSMVTIMTVISRVSY